MLIDLSHFLWAYRQALVTTAPHYALAETSCLKRLRQRNTLLRMNALAALLL